MGEEQKRFGIFKDNYDYVTSENAKDLGYKLGINQFSDLTADEVVASYTGLKPKSTWADLPHLGTHTYRWRQGLLEGEEFLGNHVWRERICPIASRQRRIWRVRSPLSTIVSSCKWLWASARSFASSATSATSASFSTKPFWFHALRETTMPL